MNTGDQRIDMPLGAYGVSLLATQRDGSVDAVEGQGKFRMDGASLLEAQPHVMAISPDGAELNKSHAVVLFVHGEGRTSLAAPEDVDVVEVGEITVGQFHAVEEVKTTREDGRLTFQLDDVQARRVVLITSKAERDRARQLMGAALE